MNSKRISPAGFKHRVALVVGVGNYSSCQVESLPNAINDARAIESALKTELGFSTDEVVLLEDPTRDELMEGAQEFCWRCAKEDTFSFFFYAGHAVDIHEARNSADLLPSDYQKPAPTSDSSLDATKRKMQSHKESCVSLTDTFVEPCSGGPDKFHLVILDACRNDPGLTRSLQFDAGPSEDVAAERMRTLTVGDRSYMHTGRLGQQPGAMSRGISPNIHYVFSTAPGKMALDGSGRNSPFTSAFLEVVRSSKAVDKKVHEFFQLVTERVDFQYNQQTWQTSCGAHVKGMPVCLKLSQSSWSAHSSADGHKHDGGLQGVKMITDCYGDKGIYQGDLVNGKANGTGTFEWPGGTYVGEFKDDKRHGQGIYTFASGSKYIGEFIDDKYNGQGTFTDASGSKYVGELKDDKVNDEGTYTYSNRDKYVSEYKDDKANGHGTCTYTNGNNHLIAPERNHLAAHSAWSDRRDIRARERARRERARRIGWVGGRDGLERTLSTFYAEHNREILLEENLVSLKKLVRYYGTGNHLREDDLNKRLRERYGENLPAFIARRKMVLEGVPLDDADLDAQQADDAEPLSNEEHAAEGDASFAPDGCSQINQTSGLGLGLGFGLGLGLGLGYELN